MDEIHELVGAYALGSLSPDEAAAFEAHLDECAACRDELASFSVVLEALAEDDADLASASGPEAPAGLASRIAAELAVTAQDGVPEPEAAPEEAPEEAPAELAAPPTAPAAVPQVADLARHRRTRRPVAAMLAAAAAVAAVFAVGFGFLLNRGDVIDVASDFDRIRLAADREDLPLDIGDATVWVSRAVGGQTEDGVAVDGTMPALGEDQTYQIWVVPADGSAPVPGPVLRPTPDGGYESAWITDLDQAAAIAVSVEPWDSSAPDVGSTTPTEVVAAVEL
ncbi:anti-sigma factor [Demequina sp.]|uniref:anti-sigma factor n=1 Tax=Demequina sp. TaxID=2050685 RepID=UPI0025E6CA16|nr:anti-sigma factor [Demequina sp.]